ncbi:uncharacterized protein BDW47DRAFT_113050 [Aspergillus candidus]|uniref:Uncharacterized protein n=1 Tax=Aspergillus candidus TaxID=41067 RepID=A0A2I2F012_ASPCN|nr:hypothetical protein BDW47DRAFT_113050 [Aspergillus candidus]PLB33975.1 hypothetical protein BDW47DRAFT_113050 [Aspergillus candidus]
MFIFVVLLLFLGLFVFSSILIKDNRSQRKKAKRGNHTGSQQPNKNKDRMQRMPRPNLKPTCLDLPSQGVAYPLSGT